MDKTTERTIAIQAVHAVYNAAATTSSSFSFGVTNEPPRMGKQYATEDECLVENGEHVWSAPFDPSPMVRCGVFHSDGHCDWHDPKRICLHCPASQRQYVVQREVKEWR